VSAGPPRSWEELAAYLRDAYELVAEEPGWLALGWRFSNGDELVGQEVKVSQGGDDAIDVVARVCRCDEADHAVGLGDDSVLGDDLALRVEGAWLVVEAHGEVGRTTRADLDDLLLAVAEQAVLIRNATAARVRRCVALFGRFA
jgi:hypothetical protein